MGNLVDFRLYLAKSKRRASTLNRYSLMLAHANTACDLTNPKSVDTYLANLLTDGRKGKYINNLIFVLRLYGKYANIKHLKHLSNMREEPYLRKVMSPKECEDFLNACNEYYACFFAISIFSGCRCGEIAKLQKDDFDFSQGLIYIRESKTDAGVRVVPVPPAFRDRLKAFVSEKQGVVFTRPTRKGDLPETDVSWGVAFHKYRKLAGIDRKGLTPHSLRASCLTELARQGVNVFTIKKLAGHKKLTTTEKYVIATTDDLINAVNTHSLNTAYLTPQEVFARVSERITEFHLEKLPVECTVTRSPRKLIISLSVPTLSETPKP